MKWRGNDYSIDVYDRYTKAQYGRLPKYGRVSFTERIRDWIFRISGKTCYECQEPLSDEKWIYYYEIDHIIPIHRGGSNELSNLQILCGRCHKDKTSRDRIQYSKTGLEIFIDEPKRTGLDEFFWE